MEAKGGFRGLTSMPSLKGQDRHSPGRRFSLGVHLNFLSKAFESYRKSQRWGKEAVVGSWENHFLRSTVESERESDIYLRAQRLRYYISWQR